MADFPAFRGRRLRRTEGLRGLARETEVRPGDLILPLFAVPGKGVRKPVPSLPGVEQTSVDELSRDATEAAGLGLGGVILFGVPEKKDEQGSGAYSEDGIVQRAVRELKREVPELVVITDVCLCEYTSHGHCGVLRGDEVDNDATLPLVAATALSHAGAGADLVAPSDMMDGRVGAVRRALDEHGYSHTPILSYAVKYASAFYGPFRDAAGSVPGFGDRKGYQMDPANVREAVREARADLREGADILMVKPALPYLDVISRVHSETSSPVWAYHVSGEYAALRAAADRGWIDLDQAVAEVLTSIRRAGAERIITYLARYFARGVSG
ncbi:MAG: porphobilinogen synthase [Longimicrobiaceae bacterium]